MAVAPSRPAVPKLSRRRRNGTGRRPTPVASWRCGVSYGDEVSATGSIIPDCRVVPMSCSASIESLSSATGTSGTAATSKVVLRSPPKATTAAIGWRRCG